MTEAINLKQWEQDRMDLELLQILETNQLWRKYALQRREGEKIEKIERMIDHAYGEYAESFFENMANMNYIETEEMRRERFGNTPNEFIQELIKDSFKAL